MTIQEIMERANVKETTLAIAYIKDAIHLIQSNSKEKIKSSKKDRTEKRNLLPNNTEQSS